VWTEGIPKMPELKPPIKAQLMSFIEFCISTWGRVPDDADLRARFNSRAHPDLDVKALSDWICSPECVIELTGLGLTAEFLHALYSKRGVEPSSLGIRPLLLESLSREQVDALSTIGDAADPRPVNRKLQELGISTQVLSSWLLDPVFHNAFLERMKKTVEVSRLMAMNSLAIKAANGDNMSIAQMGQILEQISRQQNPLPQGPTHLTNASLARSSPVPEVVDGSVGPEF